MWNAWIDLLFPKSCVGCGAKEPAAAFCAACAPLVEPLPRWRCSICAGNLPPPLPRVAEGGANERRALRAHARALQPVPAFPGQVAGLARVAEGGANERRAPRACAACCGTPPPFAEVVAPFVYGGPVAVAIHRLKYRGAREVAGRLACHLLDAGESLLEEADVVAPIPLHPNRRRGRGFDQALLLAREVHRRAGTPLARSLLRRKTEGLHQVGKGKEERSQNIQGAFAARSARGLSVVLVDDVVTTGATAAAATAALLAEGAHEVRILTLARAL